jgi:cellulose synthase/poly-beta-1,6-N-acetylglucosamine synthase-like glycosyltransferase
VSDQASITLFIGSILVLVYVFAGYPLLLGWWAWLRPRPVQRGAFEPTVSMILAVHNGERYLSRKLDSILGLRYPAGKMEILVVSDGSTDQTDQIAGSYAGKGVRLLRVARSGKAAALNAGIEAARHAILVFTDVRQSLAPESLALLLENLADAAVGAVSGELVILGGGSIEEASVGLYWRYEVWIRQRLSTIDSIFGATGAYYAVRRELAVALPADTLLDDMYLPLAAFFRGYRLIVDPRAHMFDEAARLPDEFWRKVRTLAGNYQVLWAYPRLLLPGWAGGNRMWLHFVSYKFARLLTPFIFALLLASSFGLPSPWRETALLLQAAFYAFALLDPLIPEGLAGKRLTSVVRTFVTLMAAAACATAILFVPSARLWKNRRENAEPSA